MGRIREAVETWRRQRAERRQWANAHDFAALRELTARWCLGELSWSAVGQPAPRDDETVPIGQELAAINRAGLLTHNSQPAMDFGGQTQQRAHVVGYATPETEEQLRRLIAGTRLRMTAHLNRSWLPLEMIRGAWRGDSEGAASRTRDYNGTWTYAPADLGRTPPRSVDSLSLGGVPADLYEQITEMPYICVWDPQWRPSDLLWRRLSCDWDNPPALTEEDRAPADAEPTDVEVDRLSSAMEEAFRERDLWWDLWKKSSLDSDEAAMDAADHRAAYLLDLYTAAVDAQYVESGRRRAENLARYAAEQDTGLADTAREWLSELQFGDVDPEDFDDHDLITDAECLRAADKAYDGGLQALARDLREPDVEIVDRSQGLQHTADSRYTAADLKPVASPYTNELRLDLPAPPADFTVQTPERE